MIAKIACQITRGWLYVKRETQIGIEMGRFMTAPNCVDGISDCGVPFDDHENVECEMEDEEVLWDDEE